MSLERFCRKQVVTAARGEAVSRAAEKMNSAHVGAVVIVDERRAPVGILTDRDVACRVVAAHRDPEKTSLGEVMSEEVTTVRRSGSLDEALFTMREHGVRRVPILDEEGGVCGLLSLDDLLVLLSAELNMTAQAVRSNEGP